MFLVLGLRPVTAFQSERCCHKRNWLFQEIPLMAARNPIQACVSVMQAAKCSFGESKKKIPEKLLWWNSKKKIKILAIFIILQISCHIHLALSELMPLQLDIIGAIPASKIETNGERGCDTYWLGGTCALYFAVQLQKMSTFLTK